jgi:hypothetical protein
MGPMIAFCGLDCSTCEATCDGCHSTLRLGGYCQFCSVRKCALERGFDTCAECPDFACEELQNIFIMAPQAKANLEALRG